MSTVLSHGVLRAGGVHCERAIQALCPSLWLGISFPEKGHCAGEICSPQVRRSRGKQLDGDFRKYPKMVLEENLLTTEFQEH